MATHKLNQCMNECYRICDVEKQDFYYVQRFRFTTQQGKIYIDVEFIDTVGFNVTQTEDS